MKLNKTLFLTSFMDEIWNKQLIEEVRNYVHTEYTIHLDTADPWEGQTLNHDEFKKRLRFSFESFPDLNFDITSAIEDINHMAITWVLTGTNLGKIGSFPPTGKKIKTIGMTIYHFKDNLINGHTQVFDRESVRRQLMPQ